MSIILMGKEANLLTEGCKLHAIKKNVEKRLEEIKNELNINFDGEFINEDNYKLVVVEAERFTDINPRRVHDYLKKQRMVSKFPETIKVQIEPLRKYVPESIFSRWRQKLDPVFRFNWK